MSLIKPRTRGKQRVQHRTRLDRENHETLYAYAAFINEDAEYVLNELIDTVLARDKDFMKWRAEHSGILCATRRGACCTCWFRTAASRGYSRGSHRARVSLRAG